MRYGSRLTSLIVGAAAVVFGSGAGAANEVRLSAVNFLPNNTAFGKPFAEWVEKVNERHKGVLQINLRPSGSMSPFEMGNAIRNGVVDIAHLPSTFYKNLLPVGDAINLATVPPEEQYKRGAWELLNDLHNKHVNAWYLDAWGHGIPFHVYLRDKKIDKADLSGLNLRLAPAFRAFFRSLNANSVQMAPGEVVTALQRGTIDGYGWPLWDIKSMGWDKHTKYRVEPGFYNVVIPVIVNLDKWKSLSDEQREVLSREAKRFREDMAAAIPSINESYRKEQEEAGVSALPLSDDEAQKYLRAAQDAAWKEVIELDPENAPKLREMITD